MVNPTRYGSRLFKPYATRWTASSVTSVRCCVIRRKSSRNSAKSPAGHLCGCMGPKSKRKTRRASSLILVSTRRPSKVRGAKATGKRARSGGWITYLIRKHTTSTWSAALMERSILGTPSMSSDALLSTMLEREGATPDPIDLSRWWLPGRSTARERHCERNVRSSACHVSGSSRWQSQQLCLKGRRYEFPAISITLDHMRGVWLPTSSCAEGPRYLSRLSARGAKYLLSTLWSQETPRCRGDRALPPLYAHRSSTRGGMCSLLTKQRHLQPGEAVVPGVQQV